MRPPALVVKGVHAGYPGVPVLHGVDLAVPAGALAAVLGRSGCGKTTLLRAIAGFHPVDGGTVDIGGERVAGDGTDVPPERRRVGLVPQDGALFGHLDVAANVGFGLRRARVPGRDARRAARIAEMLDLVGLADHSSRMPAELSGGQQQRVALARALAPSPALVLLDEPFTALDTGLRAEVREQVLGALRAAGATGVLVTHDQQEALGSADLVAVLRDGYLVQSAPPREVYQAPADLGVGTFVGEAVVLPATADAGWARTALGRIAVVGPDGPGMVLLRPEQLRIGGSDEATATVLETVFHGHDSTVLLEIGDLRVRCRTADPRALAEGDQVAVGVTGAGRIYPPDGPAQDSNKVRPQ